MTQTDDTASDDRIVYFDFSNLHFTGFYLNGLIDGQKRLNFRFSVSRRAPAAVRDALMAPKWLGLRFAMAAFEATTQGRRSLCVIDAHDANRLDSEGAQFGYHLPLLEAADWYFKANFDPLAVQRDPILARHAAKILPITPFIPLRPTQRYRYAPRLLPSSRDAWRTDDCRGRLRILRSPITLDRIRSARGRTKDIDVFFLTSYRRGERHQAATAMRCKLLESLAALGLPNTLLGFADDSDLPARAAAFRQPRLPLSEHLGQLGRARIVIYTRGLHDCISSKLSLALGVGATVVGQPVINQPELFRPQEMLARQLAFETPQAIVTRVKELLADPAQTAELSRFNKTFFDDWLTTSSVADCIIDTLRR